MPHPVEASLSRVRVSEVAQALGRSTRSAKRLLERFAWLPVCRKQRGTYDRACIDVLTALLGAEHRPLTDQESDWLSNYMKGHSDAGRR